MLFSGLSGHMTNRHWPEDWERIIRSSPSGQTGTSAVWFRWYIEEKVIAAFFSLIFGHTHVTFTSGEPTRRDIAGDYQGKVVSAGRSFCSSLQVPISSGSPRMFPLLPALLVIWFLLSFPSTPSSCFPSFTHIQLSLLFFLHLLVILMLWVDRVWTHKQKSTKLQ